jgi:hypothetical protein
MLAEVGWIAAGVESGNPDLKMLRTTDTKASGCLTTRTSKPTAMATEMGLAISIIIGRSRNI